MAHPNGVNEGTEGAVGFGSVQGAEVGVALAAGVEEVRFDKKSIHRRQEVSALLCVWPVTPSAAFVAAPSKRGRRKSLPAVETP